MCWGAPADRLQGRLLATGQQVLPVWKLLCFSLWVLSNRLEKEQSCTEKPYIHSSQHWKQSVGEGKKGKELGGIGNLKGSLGGAREQVWEECIYAAGLLLDMDSVQSPKGCLKGWWEMSH